MASSTVQHYKATFTTSVESLNQLSHVDLMFNKLSEPQAHTAAVADCLEKGILDLYLAKFWGLKFGTAAACTVLKVDQVSWSDKVIPA